MASHSGILAWKIPQTEEPGGLQSLLLLSRFSHVGLCATPQTAVHQAPSSLGFSRQEHWTGLTCPPPGHLPNSGKLTPKLTPLVSPALADGFFSGSATWEVPTYPLEVDTSVAQLCLTLCDPVDSSLPGSSVYGVFQARILEWVAISFSRGSSQLRDGTWVSCIAGRCFMV